MGAKLVMPEVERLMGVESTVRDEGGSLAHSVECKAPAHNTAPAIPMTNPDTNLENFFINNPL